MTVNIILSLFLFICAGAQQEPDFAEIDRTTYELYRNGSWKELITAGESALGLGIDYYYLRMRLGIAAYEINDYAKAARHFRKALEMNSADDTAMEYLYFSLKFNGRDMEADLVAGRFSAPLRQKLSYRGGGGIRSFSLNGAGSFLHDPDIITGYSMDEDPGIDGFQTITRRFATLGAGLEHSAGNRTSVTHVLSCLSKNYLLYTSEGGEIIRDENANLSQIQYYLSGRILAGNGFYLTPAVHYINVKIPYYTSAAGRGGMVFLVEQFEYQHDFAAGLGMEKHFGKIKPGLLAGYSDINEQARLQGTVSLTLFPYGNLNLYSYTDATMHSTLSDTYTEAGWVFTQELGFRAFHGLWVELWGRFGEIENYAGSGAAFIYNDAVLIKGQYGIRLIAPFLSNVMELSVNYSYSRQESRFRPDYSTVDVSINPVEINNHKIGGTIKWKF